MDDTSLVVLEQNTESLREAENIQDIQQAKYFFNQFIMVAQAIENNIRESEQRCELSKLMVEEAKNYNDAWYKIGSGRKKSRMIAESQVYMAETISSLQKGQKLMFGYQKILAKFCVVLLNVVKNEGSTNKINELTEILNCVVETAPPQFVMNEIENLKDRLEEQRRIIEEKERLAQIEEARRRAEEAKLRNSTNRNFMIMGGIIICLAIALVAMYFLK